jgi:hypothetical protein
MARQRGENTMESCPQCSSCQNFILNLPEEFQKALATLTPEQQDAVLAGLCANCVDGNVNGAELDKDSIPPFDPPLRKLYAA